MSAQAKKQITTKSKTRKPRKPRATVFPLMFVRFTDLLSNRPRSSSCTILTPTRELPTELRLLIFKHTLVNPDGIVSLEAQPLTHLRVRRKLHDRSALPWPSKGKRPSQNLQVFRVSKKVYGEAADIFYRQIFSFKNASAMQTFLLLQRPETRPRLRHFQVNVSDSEWALMPGIAIQIAQLVNLKKLEIAGLGEKTNCRDISKYLISTGRPPSAWHVTLASWDKLTGIKLARDTYPFLYPLFAQVIRDQGVGKLAEMIEFDSDPWKFLWSSRSWRHFEDKFYRFKSMPLSTERRISRGAAMADEVVKLLEQDTY